MAKLAKGNEITVKRDLSWAGMYYGEKRKCKKDVCPDMSKLRGTKVTITLVLEDPSDENEEVFYKIKEDGSKYFWTYGMFEPV